MFTDGKVQGKEFMTVYTAARYEKRERESAKEGRKKGRRGGRQGGKKPSENQIPGALKPFYFQ